MKIAVITCWWNEEKLAKMFLKSHAYADRIFVLSDVHATDRSREIATAWPKTTVEPISMPHGFDDGIKIDAINKKAQSLAGSFDWVVAVDSDEFMTDEIGVKLAMLPPSVDLVHFKMWVVYRHRSESDFDPDGDLSQRRHHSGVDFKPCIARVRPGMLWTVGCHRFEGSPKLAPDPIIGEHWGLADPSIVIERRLARKQRMSPNNKAHHWGYHCYDVTAESLLAECNAHLDCPPIPGK